MRALWAVVVVCLVAATGVPPSDAAALRRDAQTERSGSELADQRPAVPAVTAARPGSLVVALRARGVAPRLSAVVPAPPPALRRLDTVAVGQIARGRDGRTAAQLAIRSARGPPAR